MTRQAWSEHRGVYGARRLTAELHDRGHRWNRKAVARLMRLAGIEGAHRRRRGKPRRKAAATATAPDLVQRQFTATEPNRLWVADISYLRTILSRRRAGIGPLFADGRPGERRRRVGGRGWSSSPR
ncbi:IS3 family transposase [Salinispora vitiensis]|uniref:IS3 family transposase n=1 Tax=Salinispora vitiensis TaxID=999544 RepID=UPI001CC7CB75|nr:IS3 family transposase [Salinispora vitiensis]